jgi:hypothetical protein
MIYLNALRTLVCYLVLGLLLALPALPLLPFIGKSAWALNGWLSIDITICSWAHGTRYRSISGWVGQFMYSKRRYKVVAKVIDVIFEQLTGETDHCFNTYLHEVKQGFVLGALPVINKLVK